MSSWSTRRTTRLGAIEPSIDDRRYNALRANAHRIEWAAVRWPTPARTAPTPRPAHRILARVTDSMRRRIARFMLGRYDDALFLHTRKWARATSNAEADRCYVVLSALVERRRVWERRARRDDIQERSQ